MTTPWGDLLDARGAGDYTGISERFIRRLIAERRVPVHRLGRHVRLATGDLDEYIARNRTEPIAADGRCDAVRRPTIRTA